MKWFNADKGYGGHGSGRVVAREARAAGPEVEFAVGQVVVYCELYLRARRLLADEIGHARGIDPAQAEHWITSQLEHSTAQ